jgi:hypothetical protein
VDALLPVAQLYVDAFGPEEKMSWTERLRLQEIEDVVADLTGQQPRVFRGFSAGFSERNPP